MATQLDKREVLDGLFGSWDDIDELLAAGYPTTSGIHPPICPAGGSTTSSRT